MNESNLKHFKAAQISGMEVSLKDLEKINGYALSKLEPADIFAFKVCMAGNEIDRDFEVFPRSTLVKLANLFVGKTVVKDHEHKSDNQIARIYSTELVENDLARMTKTGEVFTQLIAKCYMVKTNKNADLIAEIQAGIRKEVSLGCRVDKAVCSICGTDNVKTYCEHFPGKRYNSNQLCYFSLENASDAYELSFVAVPAQAHAGTVKSYGDKPFRKSDLEARMRMKELEEKGQRSGEAKAMAEGRMVAKRATADGCKQDSKCQSCADVRENAPKTPENASTEGENATKTAGLSSNDTENAAKSTPDSKESEPHGKGGEGEMAADSDAIDAKEMLKQLHEIAQQLLVFQKSFMEQKEADQPAPAPETVQGSEQTSGDLQSGAASEEGSQDDEDKLANKENAVKPEEPGLTINPDEQGQQENNDSASDGDLDPGDTDIFPKDEAPREDKSAQPEENQEALKDKAAQARLRALDLALSLRKKH